MNERDTLHHIAQSLAAELSAADFPHFWRVVKHERGEWFQDLKTDDAWLCLQHAPNNRLAIIADKPKGMKTAGQAERITVASDRTPEAIARDIRARLLPNAREYFARCRDYTRKWKQDQDDHAQLLHMLAPFTTWKRTDSDGTRSEWQASRARADIYHDRIYSVKIENPTTDELLQILKLLKG